MEQAQLNQPGGALSSDLLPSAPPSVSRFVPSSSLAFPSHIFSSLIVIIEWDSLAIFVSLFDDDDDHSMMCWRRDP